MMVIFLKILFKFQVNRMKIEDFRNLAYVDLLASVDLKNNWWLNSVSYENPVQISSHRMKIDNFRNLDYIGLWPMMT